MTAHPVSPILLDRDQAWQVIGAQRLGLAGCSMTCPSTSGSSPHYAAGGPSATWPRT